MLIGNQGTILRDMLKHSTTYTIKPTRHLGSCSPYKMSCSKYHKWFIVRVQFNYVIYFCYDACYT